MTEAKVFTSDLYYFGSQTIIQGEQRLTLIEFPGEQKYFFTQVICGLQTIFVLDDHNNLWGLGSTMHGQLGIIKDTMQKIPINISEMMGRHFQFISCGENHVVGLSSVQSHENYQIHVWGENKHFQLNDELTKEDQKPIEISKRINSKITLAITQHKVNREDLEFKVKKLQYAYNFACCSQQHTFLIIEGILFAYGRDLKNRLGLKSLDQIKQIIFCNKKDEIFSIQQVPIKHQVVGISASQTHTLAWTDQGQLFSWGDAKDGKLGRKFSTKGWISVEEIGRVENLDDQFVIMATCGISYSIALTKKGILYGWGRFKACRSSTSAPSPCVVDIILPQQLEPILQRKSDMHAKFVKVVAGQTHFAALDVLGRIFSWGENIENCLGHMDSEDILQPTEVQLTQQFKIIDIDVGLNFTTFIALNGKTHYESSYQKNIKQNSQSHLKEEMQLIKSYSKSKTFLEERRKSALNNTLKKKQSTEYHKETEKSSRRSIANTRPSTQQLQTSLWGLLQTDQTKSKILSTPTGGQKYRLNSGHNRYMQKNFGQAYSLQNGEYHLVIDQNTNQLWENQKKDPMHLALRQDIQNNQTLQRYQKQKVTYKFDMADFYTQQVGKEFDPVKKDLLKYQYIEMIRNGQEDRHFQYIFDDKPHVWKPQLLIQDKYKLRKLKEVSSTLLREVDLPFKNYITKEQEREMLTSIHQCIERAQKILSPPSKTLPGTLSRYKNPQKQYEY